MSELDNLKKIIAYGVMSVPCFEGNNGPDESYPNCWWIESIYSIYEDIITEDGPYLNLNLTTVKLLYLNPGYLGKNFM